MAKATRDYRVISSDSHTVEPPDLWEKWLEKKYLDTAPKLVEDGDGGHAWIYMGASTAEPLGLVTCVGTHVNALPGAEVRSRERLQRRLIGARRARRQHQRPHPGPPHAPHARLVYRIPRRGARRPGTHRATPGLDRPGPIW